MKESKLSKDERIAAVKAEWADEVMKMKLPEPSAKRWPNIGENEPYIRLERKFKARIQKIMDES